MLFYLGDNNNNLAAIYVTMCLDNQICRNFWTLTILRV